MYLFYLMMILSGVHISMTITSNGLYVKHYFGGSGRIATLALVFHMIPWTLKFIYGLLIDRLLTTTKRKLKLLTYLPVFLFFLSMIPILTPLTSKQFYVFAFLISVPNAIFHTAFYSYFYQGIRTGVYEKGILGKALSCHYIGCLIGNVTYFLLGMIYSKNLESTITMAYITITLVSAFMFMINILLYRNRTRYNFENENRLNELSAEVEGINQKNWLELLKALFNLVKQKNYIQIILFLFISSFIPTFTSYYPMFLLSDKRYGGLGAHHSAYILSRIVYYVSCIVAPLLYTKYKAWRLDKEECTNETNSENNDKEEKHTPIWFKQEVVFLFFITLSFAIYNSEALFFLDNSNSTLFKVGFYQFFVVTVAVLLSMRTAAIFEFVCDSCVEGLEGSLYSIWSSLLYFSAILGDLLGLIVVTLFDNAYGYGDVNGNLMWESLKPATYVSYVVSLVCIYYGYYIQ